MDAIVAYVYLYIVVLPLLSAGAFYYTYRIRRVSGSFTGWNLLLLFALLLWLQGMGTFFGGATAAIFAPSTLSGYIAKTGESSLLSNLTFGLITSGTLFAAMFKIHGAFSRVQVASERHPRPLQ